MTLKKNDIFQFLHNLQGLGWRLGLDNITKLLSTVGEPQNQFASVHIAGTNGKGSTAAILESIFRHAGYRTGLYTSPHLLEITERIRVDGEMIPFADFSRILSAMKATIETVGNTYFEAVTAVAFQYFAEQKIDIGFIEVGLGGRFDATNVIHPLLSIITDIDLEHTEHLGKTRKQIASEKAGIVKSGTPCLIQTRDARLQEVFREVCRSRHAPLSVMDDLCSIAAVHLSEQGSRFNLAAEGELFEKLHLRLCGQHQIDNAALSVLASWLFLRDRFPFQRNDVYSGLASVQWPGRLEKISDSPKLVIDVAHNSAAMRRALRAVRDSYEYEQLYVIVGILEDKNVAQITRMIADFASHVLTVTPNSDRALEGSVLAQSFRRYGKDSQSFENMRAAYERAAEFVGQNDLILVTGSHYTVADFLIFHKKP